jgi:hypothetical protein
VPTPEQITGALARLSQDWWLLAVWWHAYLIAVVIALALNWRPSRRVAALALVIPLISAASMAWVSANPFTTSVLGLVSIAAMVMAWRFPAAPVSIATTPLRFAGVLMLVYGLVYPHFLGDASLLIYLYAAPVGIVPCPTLSVVVGFGLILRSFESRSWSLLIGGCGLFYAIVGVLYLGVALDWALFAGAGMLLASGWRLRPVRREAR